MGRSGLAVSAVGLGCNNFGRADSVTEDFPGSREVVHAALDAGITYFDTADTYGVEPGTSEVFLGRALGSKRSEVIIGTKFGMNAGASPDFGDRGSARYLIAACEASLKRLDTDYIDLYQYHTPDPLTPIEETLKALDHLVTSGKVRYIGHSNMAGWQIAHNDHVARELGTHRFISAQNHYNLIDRRAELEVLPAAREFGLGVLPYFPLANGLLTGKYTDGTAPEGSRVAIAKQHLMGVTDFDQLRALRSFAEERDLTELDVAFAFLLAQEPVASVIAGATKPSQVARNAQTASVRLTAEDLTALDEIFPPADPIALF